jgi:hypothetical protein
MISNLLKAQQETAARDKQTIDRLGGEYYTYSRSMSPLSWANIEDAFLGNASPSRFWAENATGRSVKKPPTLDGLKKSVQKIKAEPFDAKARSRIETKIQRLHKVGADAQAAILERQITVRESLLRLQEWDYKLLPLTAINSFISKNDNWDGNRGRVIIHVDSITEYQGNPKAGEAKDRIIPDNVLDELDTAEERQLFDDYAVLWAENIPDPLLLGKVDDCEDYFLIAEWGNDITFEQLMKGE